jgi:hypothetical protein
LLIIDLNKEKREKGWGWILKNTSLKLPVGVSPLQFVNLHRNRRYFVIKLHTWFCLSYVLKTNIKLYSIYQYFNTFNDVSKDVHSKNNPVVLFTSLTKRETADIRSVFLEDKHKIVLHLSILYEYQQFCQHRICFSIQPPDYSDPWPRLVHLSSFLLIRLLWKGPQQWKNWSNYTNLKYSS